MTDLTDQEKRIFWAWREHKCKPFDTAEALGIEPDLVTAAIRIIYAKLDDQVRKITPRRRADVEIVEDLKAA